MPLPRISLLLFVLLGLSSWALEGLFAQCSLSEFKEGNHAPRQVQLGLPTGFIANQGQWSAPLLYRCRLDGAIAALDPQGVLINLPARKETGSGASIRLTFVGGSPECLEGEQRLPGVYNYLLGDDRSAWHTGVPAYSAVLYQDVYQGVDVRVKSNRGQLEYDLILRSQAQLDQIKIQCEGADSIEIGSDGDLVLQTEICPISMSQPQAWYELATGERRNVDCRYVLTGPSEYGFCVDNVFLDAVLVIDPVLEWSTFFGGQGGGEFADVVVAGGDDDVFLTGGSLSPDLPGALDTSNGGRDAFVARINSEGQLIYATFLGGGGNDDGVSLAVHDSGQVVVVGNTRSVDFPVTPGAFLTTTPVAEFWSFVSRLNASGDDLVYSTLLWGGGSEVSRTRIRAVSLGASGEPTVVGHTLDSGFPVTSGVLDESFSGVGNWNGFVTRFNTTASSLVFSTFLGGTTGHTIIRDVEVDSSGSTTVTGSTEDTGLPATGGSFDPSHNGDRDAFVTRLNPEASGLLYSTFLGGQSIDYASALALTDSGDAIVAGRTLNFILPFPTTAGAFSELPSGEFDAFAARFDSEGQLVWSTLIGGKGDDVALGVDVSETRVAVTGWTRSPGFPVTPDALDGSFAFSGSNADVFLALLNLSGTELTYGTFLGGPGRDEGFAVTLNKDELYLCGETRSPEFPVTAGAIDDTLEGLNSDGFLLKLNLDVSIPFIRGDADGDAVFNGLSDALFTLQFQFVPGSPLPPCREAADSDGDGVLNGIVDGLYLLNAAFVPGSLPPPPPYPDCGADPEPQTSLGCESNACP